MRQRVLAAAVTCALMSLPAFAAAGKACEELKMEIATKIEANGVKDYELTIVKNEDVSRKTKSSVAVKVEPRRSSINANRPTANFPLPVN